MLEYNEDEVVGFAKDCEALLTPNNAGRVGVNCARMQYDAMSMGYAASRAKHLNELKAELGIPIPFTPAPRQYRGNMCGIRVPGAPPVPGGAADPSLILSWFYDRYPADVRAVIRDAWKGREEVDVLLSWPDSRAVGATPDSFVATCRELVAAGLRPAVMLCSKDHDPHNVQGVIQNIDAIYGKLLAERCVHRLCIGWELSLWLSPTDVQTLIDRYGPTALANQVQMFVHFQEGYGSFQQDGKHFADFWNPNVGKLSGLFHQKVLAQNRNQYQFDSGGLHDILIRFGGGAGCTADRGDGTPFSLIALEITAMNQFNDGMSEQEGDSWGATAMQTPSSGAASVDGVGNGI